MKEKFFGNANIMFILKGTLIGLVIGIVVSLFRLSIEKILEVITKIYKMAQRDIKYIFLILILTIIIGIITSILIKSDKNIKGSGIPEIEGQLTGSLEVNWQSILWKKFIAGVLSIGSGTFLGREGPSIQLGGAIGQGFSNLYSSSLSEKRILIASGAAAGLSAAFNAPMAGTLFILEEVYHNFSPLVWICALSSSLFSDFISSNIFGLTPVLNFKYIKSFPLKYYWTLILLGIFLGLLGYLYQKLTLIMPDLYKLFFGRVPDYLWGFLPLLMVIPIGYFAPQFLGGGNSIIIGLPFQHVGMLIITGLFLLRFVFSIVSYGSGLPGGIFLPILTLGAIIGLFFGTLLNKIGILPSVYIVNLLIFSMAGYFAGIGKAPFSAIILITEMVGNVNHLLPLAVVSLFAYITVDFLGGEPIYESLLQKKMLATKLNKIGTDIDQIEFPIYEGSSFVLQRVRDINWPNETLLSYIRNGENYTIPSGDTVIKAGDTLVVIVNKSQRTLIRKKLRLLGKQISA